MRTISRTIPFTGKRAVPLFAPLFGAFSPRSLFTGGYKGFVYDFTDASKLFQNSNGTGAVTTLNDPIGYVTDLSGNNRHGTQATAGSRPLYKISPPRALFDGSDDFLTAGTVDFTGTDKVTVIAAINLTGTGNQGLVGHGGTSAGDFNVIYSSGSASWRTSLHGSSGNSQLVIDAVDNPGVPHTSVMTFTFDLAGAAAINESSIRVNAFNVLETVVSAGPAGGGNLSSAACAVGDWLGAFKFQGSIYRIIVVGKELTANELFSAEYWCGQGAGIPILSDTPPSGDVGITHLPSYGQSLSVGTQSRPAISTSASVDYMFTGTGGVRAWDSSTPYSALVNHYELDSATELMGETPCYGAYQMIRQAGYGNKFLASAPGFGAVTLADLSTGGGYYTRFMNDITNGRKLSRALGQHYKLRGVMWMQGESDGANATYASDLNTFRTTLDADVKSRTNQTDDVWLISYQLDRAKIGLAHLQAQESYSRIKVAMPMYHLAKTDGVHLTATSSKIAGAYLGYCYKQVVVDGNTSWKPLMVTGSSVAGANIDLTYNVPTGSLTLDTTIVPSQTNSGFRLVDSGGSALTISSVSITGANTVRIVAAAPVPAGAKVYYGFSDPTDHTADIAKGNLRDTQGDTVIFDGGGINYPMHNWAVLQQVSLP